MPSAEERMEHLFLRTRHSPWPLALASLAARTLPPLPWAEGDNIPWHDPAFSRRMLAEHLSQSHDAASRRTATIERQVAWIHATLLHGRPTSLLDLSCGPGLYTSRLAARGHTCTGIDYSPAAIAYATAHADEHGLSCRYQLADVREADFGSGYGLVMLIFGELNVFPQESAERLLAGMHSALADGGMLLLEPHTFDAVREMGEGAPSWYTAERGLFGDTPYLCLTEHFWHATECAATTRYYIVELASGAVTRYAQSFQAYTADDYRALLRACGFTDIAFFPSLTGEQEPDQADLRAIVARKGGS